MKSYEKLKAKISIYENLIENLDFEIRDMLNKPDSFAPSGECLNDDQKRLLAEISRMLSHEIYLAERQIWSLK